MDTIFSKIISGEIPCEKIYEDDHVFAFLDIIPTNPGHTLVVPKKWSSDLLDTDEETLKRLIVVVQKIAKAVMEATGAVGVNVAQNNREGAGQKVFHLHFHVIPRFEGDGYEHWHGKPYENGEEKLVGEKIRKML
ncbi:HIT family protein [Candidatus Uhrbacteria bacterium]|nr:HIT family protein [Candidatus Uhrbacteria bacterium]